MNIRNGLKLFLRYWRKSNHPNLRKPNDSKSPMPIMNDSQSDIKSALRDSELKKPLDPSMMGGDVAALNNLLGFLNDPNVTGAHVPKGEQVKAVVAADRTGATVIGTDPALAAGAVLKPVAARPAARSTRELKPITATRFMFTGRLKAGKDHTAAAIDAKIFGFADPLYHLLDYFFGTSALTDPKQKDLPGARAFLQAAGQWGWGANDEKYPFTPARAVFTQMVRALGRSKLLSDDFQVDWESFGCDQEIWVKAVIKRIEANDIANPGQRVAIVNCRFEHEFTPLRDAGFSHWHVMCSPKTWAKRLAAAGLTAQSPQVNDLSEKFAAGLDADVIRKISNRAGGMLHVIWNDPDVPPPSPRVYTLAEFLQSVSENPVWEIADEAVSPANVSIAAVE